jgi:hypothetical protein
MHASIVLRIVPRVTWHVLLAVACAACTDSSEVAQLIDINVTRYGADSGGEFCNDFRLTLRGLPASSLVPGKSTSTSYTSSIRCPATFPAQPSWPASPQPGRCELAAPPRSTADPRTCSSTARAATSCSAGRRTRPKHLLLRETHGFCCSVAARA